MPKPLSLKKLIKILPGYDPNHDKGKCTFDEEAAQDAIDFFPTFLIHVKGEWAGQPFELEDWEKAIIANLFGWKRPDSTRRYRESLIFVPRKNGKTPFGAGIASLVFHTDNEPGMEAYSFASEADQAALVFNQAKQMMKSDPDLAGRINTYVRSIALKSDPLSVYKYVSSTTKSKHGYNIHFAAVDELHVCETGLIETIETATSARRQPLVIYLTTSDFARESICNEKHKYACDVRDGIIEDPYFLPVIYEISDEDLKKDPDCWKDRDFWYKVNPNLGVSKKLDDLERQFTKACVVPRLENEFKRLNLNIKTEQVTRWLSMDQWAACGGDADPKEWRELMLRDLRGKDCEAAIDLGATNDLTALVLLFTDKKDRIVIPFFWAPRDGAREKEERHRVPYLQWAREGWIELTEGPVTDYDFVRDGIAKLAEQYGFHIDEESRKPVVAIDRGLLGVQFCTDLADDGFEPLAFGQGFLSMFAPTREFEELVMGGHLLHGNNPVLTWMARNVSIKTDPAGSMKAVKPERKEAAKIDGIIACIMALGMAMSRKAQHESWYETHSESTFISY